MEIQSEFSFVVPRTKQLCVARTKARTNPAPLHDGETFSVFHEQEPLFVLSKSCELTNVGATVS